MCSDGKLEIGLDRAGFAEFFFHTQEQAGDWRGAGMREVDRAVDGDCSRVCSPSMPRSAHGAQRVSSFRGPKVLSNGRRPRLENMTCALNVFRLSWNACSTVRLEEAAPDWRSIILDIFSELLTAERPCFANRARSQNVIEPLGAMEISPPAKETVH